MSQFRWVPGLVWQLAVLAAAQFLEVREPPGQALVRQQRVAVLGQRPLRELECLRVVRLLPEPVPGLTQGLARLELEKAGRLQTLGVAVRVLAR